VKRSRNAVYGILDELRGSTFSITYVVVHSKAAYPINVMGQTKAFMEKLMVGKARVASHVGKMLCRMRYGSVIASDGSANPPS
jgi:UDP-glucose 4-epimerase